MSLQFLLAHFEEPLEQTQDKNLSVRRLPMARSYARSKETTEAQWMALDQWGLGMSM